MRFPPRFSGEPALPKCNFNYHSFVKANPQAPSSSLALLFTRVFRKTISILDRNIRRRLGIFEYTQAQDCILRASLRHAGYAITLDSGERIEKGDLILELHFWNERVASVLNGQTILSRGIQLRRSIQHSLTELATSLESRDDMQGIQAVHARLARNASKSLASLNTLGFQFIPTSDSYVGRLHDALESVLIYGLCWTFRPACQRRPFSAIKRIELWLPKQTFIDLYFCKEPPTEATGQSFTPTAVKESNSICAGTGSVSPVKTDSLETP